MRTHRKSPAVYRIVFLLGCLGASPEVARASELLQLQIEPIIGYERVQKLVPTAHTKERMLYGARVTGGIPLVALEGEYTQGTDTESFPSDSLTVKDQDEKLKLGLRSQLRLTSLLSLTGRGGVQAKRNTHTETLSGVSTTTVNPITYKPYAGAALSSRLGGKFELTGGLTVVFNQFPDMSQNEYQATLGFSVRLP